MRALAASLLCVVGCNQILGVDEYAAVGEGVVDASTPLDAFVPTPEAASPTAPEAAIAVVDAGPWRLQACGRFPYDDPECGTCVETKCCAEAEACGNDSVCRDTHDCYAKCAPGDADCRGTCNSIVPYDVPAERALQRCLATSCNEECDVGCGAMLPRERGKAFRARTECCAAEDAMWRNDDAFAWQECQSQCFWPQLGQPTRANECGCVDRVPGAAAVADVLAACANQSRRSEADWSCVGEVIPSFVDSSQTLELRMRLCELLAAETTIAGVEVSACGGYAGDCQTKLGVPGTTDATGTTTLTFASRLSTSAEFYPYLLLRGATIPNTLLYHLSPPIQQSRWDARSVLTLANVRSLYELGEVTPNASLGSVGVLIQDCSPTPAAGVEVKIEQQPDLRALYGTDANGVGRGATQTSRVGHVFFPNVTPGALTITARRVDAQQPLVRLTGILVRADAVTIVVASPLHPQNSP